MYQLLSACFKGVDENQFAEDLAGKNWVIILEDDAGRLMGFSTLLYYRSEHEGEKLTVVYSGDTIVDRRAWGSSALSRTWIDSIRQLHRDFGQGRLLWLLITSGYRTYRFLPVFWRHFFPHYDRPTPRAVQRLIDRLASERFGERYDPCKGIVVFDRPQVLHADLSGIPASKLKDPHVAFFASANPGYVRGDELVCVTEISEENLTPAGWRMVRAGTARRVPSRRIA